MFTPEEIRDLRLRLGRSATELALEVGVSENTWRRWEMGERRPRRSCLILLHQLAGQAKPAGRR